MVYTNYDLNNNFHCTPLPSDLDALRKLANENKVNDLLGNHALRSTVMGLGQFGAEVKVCIFTPLYVQFL